MTIAFCDLGIVADDLTGACDVAARIAPRLGSVRVVVSLDFDSRVGQVAKVINTQSRTLECESAHDLLYRVGSTLSSKRVVFKKIDAGLRGPVGAELTGLLAGLNRSGREWSCIVAPAIPSIGRVTRDGVQYDYGIPIDQGELGHDPYSPPVSADIRQAIKQTGGGGFCVADAESPGDLERIVDAHLADECVVFAGSLGLAQALAGRLRGDHHQVETAPPVLKPIIVCGSRHPRSWQQVEQAQGAGVRVLGFDPAQRHFDTVIGAEWKGKLMVRILPGDATAIASPAGSLLASFVEALASLWEELNPDGLGVVGGETAYQLLRRLGARELEVFESEAEVIAVSRIVGGSMDGRRFVSKGGSVGPDDAACQMLSLLTR